MKTFLLLAIVAIVAAETEVSKLGNNNKALVLETNIT
jgi:hypothetical protein